MQKHLLYFSLLLTLVNPIFGQFTPEPFESPYELSKEKDIPLLAGGAATFLAGLIAIDNVRPYTAQQLGTLDRHRTLAWDRQSYDKWNPNASRASDYVLYGSMSISAMLLLDKNIRKDVIKIGTMFGEMFLFTGGFTGLSKGLFHRTRPFVFNENVPEEEKLKKGAQLSFISGHTSSNASITFFAAKVFSDYNPNSKYKPLVWSAAVLLPATTAYLRVKAGKHYPTDVIAGYAVGALVGYFVPVLHKKRKNKFSLTPLSDGDSFSLMYQKRF